MKMAAGIFVAACALCLMHLSAGNVALFATFDGRGAPAEQHEEEAVINHFHRDTSIRECMSIALTEENNLRAVTLIVTNATDITGLCIIVTPAPPNCTQPVPDPCDPNPCKHTGVCRRHGGNNDQFTCECPYPLGGRLCEELICENCFRKDDMVIFMNDSMPSMSWQESFDRCKLRGMTMLLDKDADIHEFVRKLMVARHPDGTLKIAYWIGISRASNDAPFMYVDGTPVRDSHAPWATGRPGSSNCINIANTAEFDWKWDDDVCEGFAGWTYYNLCQRRYPFLLE